MVPTFPSARDLAAAVPGVVLFGDPEVRIEDASCDSREVAPGSVFFCIRGEHADGHAFAGAAVAAGAVAVVADHRLEGLAVPQLLAQGVREAAGPIAAEIFSHPARTFTIAGFTGTNGKTTCTYLMGSVFAAAGLTPGRIGTTGAWIDTDPVPIPRTTPEAPDLQRLLARMRTCGVRAVAMEVSSHALEQHRVGGFAMDVAVFTNLSQDHLDFHADMEHYFRAKARLFTPPHALTAVVNIDDAYGRRLIGEAGVPVTTVGVDSADADLRARDVRVDAGGIGFRVDDLTIRSNLLGSFNVINCLEVVAAARRLGIAEDAIAEGIEALEGVPGRVESLDLGQGFLAVVDYAHTPDSIHSVLRAMRPLVSGKLICVFGCGGDRDRAKRPLMGAAAVSDADLTVITSDNPRSEDPLEIIRQIEIGAIAGPGAFTVEVDRRAAIKLALRSAVPGDGVVIAGKGHEAYQEVRGEMLSFDDREIARTELVALMGEPA
ncbi:MAG: UDP-N-acetylmuramoyl-L-alanyl-D-glutamate--2,6-diaminopimelate ligase [Actinomycetota bacterium]